MTHSSDRRRPFQTLSSAIVWSCPWYRVRQDAILMPDGRTGTYNTVEKSDAVWILPVTVDGRIPLLYQYRYTIDDWCWEIPAGSVEDDRTLEETARIELLEEVGGVAQSLEYIAPYYLANGICNERGHFFLATGVELGTPTHEAAEVIEIHLHPIADVLAMVHAHQITDGPSALAILLCADRLRALAGQTSGAGASAG
jgi:ADP-ribose pyrophosphatase